MPIPFKKSTSSINNTVKKGNIVFSNRSVNSGPSSTTGYFNPPDPVLGGHILIDTSDTDPKCFSFENDADLIEYYNNNVQSTSNISTILTTISDRSDLCLLSRLPLTTNHSLEDHQKVIDYTSVPSNSANTYVKLKGRYSEQPQEHGCEFVAMTGGVVNYCAPYPGTVVRSVPYNGAPSTVVSSTSNPSVGTFSVTTGVRYFSNKPISLLDEAAHHVIAPLSYKGKALGHYGNRGWNATLRIYALEQGTTSIKWWRDSIGGTLVSSHTLSEYNILTRTLTSADWNGKFGIIEADKNIVATIDHDGSDRYVLPVLDSGNIYSRYNEYEINSFGNSPSVNNSYVIQDTRGCFRINIADGSGNEAEAGMPLKFLGDTYAFGSGELRSYFLAAPYGNTQVTASYWNGSSWTEYDNHLLNGLPLNPAVHSEGEQNGGTNLVDGTTRPWKFEGTEPFYIVVNDGSADEEALLGWKRDNGILAIAH